LGPCGPPIAEYSHTPPPAGPGHSFMILPSFFSRLRRMTPHNRPAYNFLFQFFFSHNPVPPFVGSSTAPPHHSRSRDPQDLQFFWKARLTPLRLRSLSFSASFLIWTLPPPPPVVRHEQMRLVFPPASPPRRPLDYGSRWFKCPPIGSEWRLPPNPQTCFPSPGNQVLEIGPPLPDSPCDAAPSSHPPTCQPRPFGIFLVSAFFFVLI